MMKSFFKKLAFVMALAMVVSVMAPAGSAFAAEATVALKDKTAVTEHALAVGAEEDYCFLGAPKNWKELGWKWTSSNPEVATVDEVTGLTKGVADGVATITVTVGDEYTAAVVVTVGAGEVVDNSYTYTQVSHKKATFTFAQDVNYAVEDVELVKVFAGGYEVSWPIETFKCEKNVVTVEPYVAFADGDEYIIKIGAEDEGTTFKTTLGAVDYIEIAYKSLDKKGVAYAKLDEDDEDIDVTLSVKLFSNGVDVTEAEGYDLDNVEFELVSTSDNYDIDEDILVFEKYGEAATVKATYTAEDDTKWSNVTTIISQPAPKYTIVSVDKWVLAPNDTTASNYATIDWSKSLKHSIPAFDDADDVALVVLMTDSYGNKIVYPDKFATKSKLGTTKLLTLSEIATFGDDDYIEASEGFEIRYTSTNANKIFIGETNGLITTLGESKAPVLVSLYDENNDGETVLVKNLFAAGLEVTEERHPDKITTEVWIDKLLVDITDALTNKDFEKGYVRFTVVDQYGDAISGTKVYLTENDERIEADGETDATNAYGQVVYEFDGADFAYVNSKGKTVAADSVKFTAKLGWPFNNVSTSLTIKTATAELDTNGAIVVEGYEIAADDKDMKVAKAADGTTVETAVTVYETSNGLRVNVADNVTLLTLNDGSGLLKDGKGAFSIKSNVASEGALFAVVYDPNGAAVYVEGYTDDNGTKAVGISGNNGEYTVKAATPVDDVMTYMATGTYVAKLYEVTRNYTDNEKNAKVKELSTSFTLKNTSATVSVKEQDYIDLPANDIDAETLEEVVFEAFDFKVGSSNLKEKGYAILVAAKTKFNASSNSLYIYEVTFAVPLNNGTDEVYYLNTVKINKSVKVGSEYTHNDAYNK